MSTEKPRFGIIISMFPELHETFILRELVALERRGLVFDIYSLQYPRDPITLDDAIRLSTERTTYSSLISAGTLAAFFKTLLSKPVKTLSAIGKLIWYGKDRPVSVLKNLAILPVTLYFYKLGSNRGIQHWHGHWANVPTTACWFLQQIHGVSWSAAIHGEDIFSKNRFLSYKLNSADFSVVCSGHFCHHLQHNIGLANPSNVHLNYHGLDPRVMERAASRAFKQRDTDDTVQLLSIGRLVPTKGHDVLIKACAQIKNSNQFKFKFKLKIIGSGPIEAELKALVVSEGVQDEVEFLGGIAFEEVLSTLEQTDIFCLAPRLIPGHPPDGIPNVIAEAMALRVPVVSTRVSAIPELIDSGVSGQLAEVDDVEGFATALSNIATDPALAQQLSDAGFDKVAQLFNQQRNIDELIALFERYIPGKVV